jgi:hypothetical protein
MGNIGKMRGKREKKNIKYDYSILINIDEPAEMYFRPLLSCLTYTRPNIELL